MFNFFRKKKKTEEAKPSDKSAGLVAVYSNLLKIHSDSLQDLEKNAKKYIDADNYADPIVWMDALAICDVALTNNKMTETIIELYRQLYSRSWNKHVSAGYNDTDYVYWFKLNEDINTRFIEAGCTGAFAEQADLYANARRPYRDYKKMKEYFLKGIEAGDPTSMGDYGYGLYYGMKGYGEADKEEGLRLINKSKELGYELAELLLLHLEFYDNKDNDTLLAYIENYIQQAPPTHKAYYLLADYYSRLGEYEKAIDAMRKGVGMNDHYCQYQYGMAILKGQVQDVEKTEGIRLLEEAFSYNIIYAANFLGQYYYYANDENTSVDKAIEWHEKAVSYYSSDSAYELAVIYLYNEKYKDWEKADKYLELAISEDSHRAMSEKGYLLIEYLEPEKRDPQEAKRLFEKAMELGNDYAPYRLGVAYERGEFGDEEQPDYKKILELYELAAERGSVYGMDMAGHYYRLGYADESEDNAAKAIDYFNQAIARNSGYSRVELALCYETGYGVDRDYRKAFDLFSQAAENNYPYALLKMGYYLEDGLVGEQDYAAAFENFQKAHEAGHPEGTYNLGRYYRYAVGIPENPELAIRYFEEAAEKGDGQAKIELALIYEQGYGGKQFDAQKAMDYMTEAAEYGYPYAQYKVGYYHYYGLIEQDLQKGLEWFTKSYEQGYPYSALMLGDYYLYNHGGEAEYDKAFNYYKFAESQDCISEGLGVCYEYGIGVEENNTEAFKYYNLAADRGYSGGKYRLGLCYKYGTGTTENPAEAYRWFSEAAEEEHFGSKYEAAMLLLEGVGVEKDELKAIDMLMKVADEDHADAQYELGNCYLTGKGVEADDVQAMVWYQRAADNGHEQAQKLTGKRERRKR